MVDQVGRFSDGMSPPSLAGFASRLDNFARFFDDFLADLIDAPLQETGGVRFFRRMSLPVLDDGQQLGQNRLRLGHEQAGGWWSQAGVSARGKLVRSDLVPTAYRLQPLQ